MKKANILTSVAFWIIIFLMVLSILFLVFGKYSNTILNQLEDMGLYTPEIKKPANIGIEEYRDLAKLMIEKGGFNIEVHFLGEVDIKGSPFDEKFHVTKIYNTKTGLIEKEEQITIKPEHITSDNEKDEDIGDIDYISAWGLVIPDKNIRMMLPEPSTEVTSTFILQRAKLNEKDQVMTDLDGNPILINLVVLKYLGIEGKTIKYRITPAADIQGR